MLPVHFQQALSLGIPGDMRQHTQKEKTKVKELGQKAKIPTALFFFDPIAGDFSVRGHIPNGETIPDFNLLICVITHFQNYIREPQAYPRRQRRLTRNARRQQEDTAEVGQTSPTGSSPTETLDTFDESNPLNMRKEEALFLLDKTNGNYIENGISSLEEEMPVDPFGTLNSGDDEPIEGSPKAMVPAPELSKTTRA
ncbi:hypothetical protein B0J13DRAFT_553275 [Dactylonectria estremocensis]|uniref:Uncharacterized protein n=1 Tax=Dactylonectria estremocensis TaxID=1079267 RepID=A0A9P9EYU5_9HYPO|nr:hypothetical protein B0J13DRAFT_553275 [Dactylonectria estremocensis]